MGKILCLALAVVSVFGAPLIAKPTDARPGCRELCDGGFCERRVETGSGIVVVIGAPLADSNRHLFRRQQAVFRAASQD
jgi:hypothetical protein